MGKVLITTPTFAKYSSEAPAILAQAGLEAVRAAQPVKSDRALLGYLDGVTAIITGLEPITATVIDAARELKVIAKHGIGVDNIDLEAARRRGIRVVNAPGTNKDAVADLVFGLMFALTRRLLAADASVRKGEWPRMFGQSVWGKKIGIVGMGAIGKAVALRAEGFRMPTFGYDTYWDEQFAAQHGVQRVSLEALLGEADFVTLHVPLLEETRNLIGEAELRLMKPTAFLINAARGGVVDEAALHGALTAGTIAGAGLDAFDAEPPLGSPLLALDNVVLTPHMGAYTEEALGLTSVAAAQSVVDVLAGRQPLSVIV
jgi:D-3-phosphoglycerate dehydrogenase